MADIFQDDFRDFIQALNDNKVSYIVVGGFAVILYGHAIAFESFAKSKKRSWKIKRPG